MPKRHKLPPQPSKPNLGAASHLVAYVLGGGLLGFGFDWLLGSLPWGMIGGILVGFAAWIYLLMQAEAQVDEPAKPR